MVILAFQSLGTYTIWAGTVWLRKPHLGSGAGVAGSKEQLLGGLFVNHNKHRQGQDSVHSSRTVYAATLCGIRRLLEHCQ